MKKFISIFLILTLLILPAGCTSKKELSKVDKKRLEERKQDYKDAQNLIKLYMELVMQGKRDEARKYIAPSSNKKDIKTEFPLKPLGYSINRIEKIGNKLIASVKLSQGVKGKAYYTIDIADYTIGKKSDGDMVIENIQVKSNLVFFEAMVQGEKSLLLREDTHTEAIPVLKAFELPDYIANDIAFQPLKKVRINREKYGSAAISNDGKKMILCSVDGKNTIALAVERVVRAFNSKDKKVAEAAGTGGGGGTEKEEGASSGEAQRVDVVPLDYFEGATVEYVTFSPSGDCIYIQTRKGDKVGLSLYSTYSLKILSPKLMEKFNSPEYNIINAYFNNEDTLLVSAKNLKENKVENYILDIKNDVARKQGR
ncbi:hypothetical protein [Clostridium cylindrosporum]|uniref:Uncharacterized protein n=1 Tax=Clostridium cylindrosporum DSM 605 TaxID=1121307 RepID=A0A0J8D7R1_CLOCY|nr:hypothetical protein [Clostridium cylindrosporum]KMT22075.1 hypothetical protein CLCY_4c00480 [Clostridium cylindrosporum DSM 605]